MSLDGVGVSVGELDGAEAVVELQASRETDLEVWIGPALTIPYIVALFQFFHEDADGTIEEPGSKLFGEKGFEGM